MIVRAGGAIWLNIFATVLFSVCTAVTVEWCVCCYVEKKGRRLFSRVFAITERRDMSMYEVLLSVSLWGFGMETMLAKFHVRSIMFLLRPLLNILARNACFRCLIFSLSGTCALLFLLCFISSWT